jgi:hypothetical protein
VKEIFPAMGVFRLWESNNHPPLEEHTVVVEPHEWRYVSSWGDPQTERLVQTSDQHNMANLNCKVKVKEGSGTVPWGYAKLRGEQ